MIIPNIILLQRGFYVYFIQKQLQSIYLFLQYRYINCNVFFYLMGFIYKKKLMHIQ
jgi:hypothetical protein